VTPQHVFPWLGCTRILTTLAVAQLVERDLVALDDTVGTHIQASGPRADCRLRHLLTHMGGFAVADSSEVAGSDAEMRNIAFSTPAEHPPGLKAVYHRSAAWRVLGEVVATVAGCDLETYIRRELWEPLGMNASYLSVDAEDRERLGDWLVLAERAAPIGAGWTGSAGVPPAQPSAHASAWFLERTDPDLGGHGPAHDLARPFEALITGNPIPIRDQMIVELLAGTHRVGLRDAAFSGGRIPWGLGFMVAGGFAGTVGHRSFGHDGLPGGRVLCDPEEGLVMVFLTSGLVGPTADAERLADVTTAVYEVAAPRPAAAWVDGDPDVVALRG
jgi:CubicO group peptidase (beta-lactamase class C family)